MDLYDQKRFTANVYATVNWNSKVHVMSANVVKKKNKKQTQNKHKTERQAFKLVLPRPEIPPYP